MLFLIDRKKASCAQMESSKMDCSRAEASSSVAVDSTKAVDESSSSKWFASTMMNSCHTSENMMLRGGKSTPVSRKGNEPESKAEKETAVCSDQQASALVRDSGSLKNMNRQIASGLTGLENYANNCYMNVVIQALANIPEIRDYFMCKHHSVFLCISMTFTSKCFFHESPHLLFFVELHCYISCHAMSSFQTVHTIKIKFDLL